MRKSLKRIKTKINCGAKARALFDLNIALCYIECLAKSRARFSGKKKFCFFASLVSITGLKSLNLRNKINSSEYAPEADKKYLTPFNHPKSANNLLIVSRGNWSKLIRKIKESRRLQERRASIIAHKQFMVRGLSIQALDIEV